MDMTQFVAGLPKVELHLHLVGSAAPETVLALARRHPDGGVPTEPEPLRRFYAFTGFPHFLDVYAQVNLLVRTGADVVTLIDGLAAQLAAATVRYAEVQVTPVRNRMAGISFDDLAPALTDGRTLALERHGVELGWIFDADAALGPPGAAETVAFAGSTAHCAARGRRWVEDPQETIGVPHQPPTWRADRHPARATQPTEGAISATVSQQQRRRHRYGEGQYPHVLHGFCGRPARAAATSGRKACDRAGGPTSFRHRRRCGAPDGVARPAYGAEVQVPGAAGSVLP
jgi:Adenosine deaminase